MRSDYNECLANEKQVLLPDHLLRVIPGQTLALAANAVTAIVAQSLTNEKRLKPMSGPSEASISKAWPIRSLHFKCLANEKLLLIKPGLSEAMFTNIWPMRS